MTKAEAAAVLVDMACTLREKVALNQGGRERIHEAVAIACGELMIDTVLEERARTEEG